MHAAPLGLCKHPFGVGCFNINKRHSYVVIVFFVKGFTLIVIFTQVAHKSGGKAAPNILVNQQVRGCYVVEGLKKLTRVLVNISQH